MRGARWLAIGLCSLMLAHSAFAQATAGGTVKAAPKDSEVLQLVPAGSMGVFAVNNVKDATGKLDRFLLAIGAVSVEDALKSGGGGSLGYILQMLEMEEGFRPEGGFAVAMLDPQQFKIDLIKAFQNIGGRARGNDKIPFAIYIPGKSINELFAEYDVSHSEVEKYPEISFPFGPLYAMELKGYVVLSPLPKALDAIAASKKGIATSMTKEQAASVMENDVVFFIDLRVAGPVLDKVFEMQQAMSSQMSMFVTGPIGLVFKLNDMLSQYQRDTLKQMDSATICAKFVAEGIVVDERIAFVKDSNAAKVLAETKPLGKERLDRLPAANYMFVMDATCQSGPQSDVMRDQIISAILSSDVFDEVSDADKLKIMGVVENLSNQVTRGQFVIGGGPDGESAFAMATVMQVKDSATYVNTMKDAVAVINKLVKNAVAAHADDETAEKFAEVLTYTSAVAKVGNVTVDEIRVNVPEDVLDEEAQEQLQKFIGDTRVRVLLASIDKTTVVATLGGSQEQMAATIQTATKGGGVDLSKAQVSGMKYMPANRVAIGAIHVANILENIRIAAGDEPSFLPELKADAPILIASSAVGTQARVVIFVPSAMIQDIVQAVKSMTHRLPDGDDEDIDDEEIDEDEEDEEDDDEDEGEDDDEDEEDDGEEDDDDEEDDEDDDL
ncbi:MAG: hypothetical protein FWE88_06695 [Phycisphaerae bacterium]|nr:hypothetical protein [Phycisphaerae bacterium]